MEPAFDTPLWYVQKGSGPSGRQKRPKPAFSGQESSLLSRYQTHHIPKAKERTYTYLKKHITKCFD